MRVNLLLYINYKFYYAGKGNMLYDDMLLHRDNNTINNTMWTKQTNKISNQQNR